ncbi:alpha/beta fold hydrolase [Allorhizocola rhizosphaerae]|uniref:alpha/beta fold hydrolase n=1 Tax=Allorhizocola rhizosphaerae TaxID=1872709 RepID=UPI000E3BBEF9|nr:alpha/beta hydrolase [Allorhizocola rhizosphaerae]
MESRVLSRDGTPIAYQVQGKGPAVVLVGGGLDDGAENVPLAAVLAEWFTVHNFARRGRGDSGDTQPYAVAREIEDLAALIEQAGGSAHLFGASSGGALALEAAAAGLPVGRVAVYEVPYNVEAQAVEAWRAYVSGLNAVLADGRRDDAVALFMRLAGASDEDIAEARNAPFWPSLRAIAHTLAYEAACLGDGPPPAHRFSRIAQPVLVATGEPGVDPHTPGLPADFYARAADELMTILPRAQRLTLKGQAHVGDPEVLGDALHAFFSD